MQVVRKRVLKKNYPIAAGNKKDKFAFEQLSLKNASKKI
jgi:hypothetical protein